MKKSKLVDRRRNKMNNFDKTIFICSLVISFLLLSILILNVYSNLTPHFSYTIIDIPQKIIFAGGK